MVRHYVADYLQNPIHPITIAVVGCGGNGSSVINALARMNKALLELGHKGLDVFAYDDDKVSKYNVGRQLFFPSDVGEYKSISLISKINKFFGFHWVAQIEKVKQLPSCNIVFLCVDSASAREKIYTNVNEKYSNTSRCFYIIDLGNGKSSGQVFISTNESIKQPKSSYDTVDELDSPIEVYGNLKQFKEEDDLPSCSMAQSINGQGLFTNSILSQLAVNALWEMLTNHYIEYDRIIMSLSPLLITHKPISNDNTTGISGGKTKYNPQVFEVPMGRPDRRTQEELL